MKLPEGRVSLGASRDQLEVVTPEGEAVVPLLPEQAAALVPVGAGGDSGKEIERRYLVASEPDLTGVEGTPMRQGYFLAGPGVSFRIREKKGVHRLTLKQGTGLARTEVEFEVGLGLAETLWPLVGDRIVAKTRYVIPDGDGAIELDRYEGRHEGLVVAEREFAAVTEAFAWTAPAWMGTEVTEDSRYTAARLAMDGLPPA